MEPQLLSGIDVQLDDLLEEILHGDAASLNEDAAGRLLVLDTSGRTLAHPLLPPAAAHRRPSLASLETGPGFQAALHHMTSLPSGTFTSRANITYTWQHVRLVCMIGTPPEFQRLGTYLILERVEELTRLVFLSKIVTITFLL